MRPHEKRSLLRQSLLLLAPLLLATGMLGQSDKHTNSNPPPKAPAPSAPKQAPQPAPTPRTTPPTPPPAKQPVPSLQKPSPQTTPPRPMTPQPRAGGPPTAPTRPDARESNRGGNTPPVRLSGKVENLPGPSTSASPRILSSKDSDHQIKDLNKHRKELAGINKNPLPKGQVTLHPDGHRAILDNNGRQFDLRADGTVSKVSLKDGRSVAYRPDGTVGAIHTKDMEIVHGAGSSRVIRAEAADHARVVSTGKRYGYVERPVTWKGRDYVYRSYVAHDLTYTRVYRTYTYNNVVYERYVPAVYYAPRFYGWAYYPWQRPVVYSWGWEAEPWYAYSGPYFVPYQSYSSPSLWVADFVLASQLRLGYEASQDVLDGGASGEPSREAGGSPISPETKQAIADQVRDQVTKENGAATQSGLTSSGGAAATSGGPESPSVLDPEQKLYIVSSILQVQTADGLECKLTQGDILWIDAPIRGGDQTAQLHVDTAQGGDCPEKQKVTLRISDLEEMHNDFLAMTDDALKTLAANQGKKGLPPAPPPNPYEPDVPAKLEEWRQRILIAAMRRQDYKPRRANLPR